MQRVEGQDLAKFCALFISMGYDNTMCSATGRPYTPKERSHIPHPSISEMDLIRKDSVLDPNEDDDDIDWSDSPYEVNALDESSESPTELLALITIKRSTWLQKKFKALCMEFIDVFATKVRRESAMVDPMEIKVDHSKWQLPCNRAPPNRHSEEKQVEIRKQVEALLQSGVIQESQATEWSQVHLVPKTDGTWRFTLDFVRLNTATGGLEGWPIPNIQQIINRLMVVKPKVFGLIDFTAGYHQTPLHSNSWAHTASLHRVDSLSGAESPWVEKVQDLSFDEALQIRF